MQEKDTRSESGDFPAVGWWSSFHLLSRFVFHPLFRWTRGMTLGVRAMVIDPEGRVLLVRHSYAPGWLFPGGGVERGETAMSSLERELREEASVTLAGAPDLFGLYSNESYFRGDHIAFYVVRAFHRGDFHPNREILEARFFDSASLPRDTSAATQRRILEVQGGREKSPDW